MPDEVILRTKTKRKIDEEPLSCPPDFTSPDELYEELKKEVLKYHPSTDLSLIDKAYQVAKVRCVSRENPTLYILFVLQSS